MSPGGPSVFSPRRRVMLVQTWWLEPTFRGVAEYAAQARWILQAERRWTGKLPRLEPGQVDGIIAYVGEHDASRPARALIRRARVPVVDLATYADHFSAPRVFGRDEERGRLAAEHLVSLGLRDFGFVTFHDNPYQTHRMEGFRLGIERAGGRFQVITRSEFARRLPSLPRPMGLATMGDIFSVELIQLCLSHGVQVPEEFAIIGIDDTEVLCDFAPVALSSVNCDHFGIGYQAAALLDRLMRGEAPPSRPVLVPARGVTVRASTDMLAIPDLTTRKILRFLRTNHSRPIRLKDLPPDLLPGLRNAQRHFKAYTGRSFVEELTRLRLEHARRLLVSTRDKIATLARAAGFTQTAYFCRVFKKSTGMSPKAYQRSRRQENAVRAGPA